MVHNQTKDVSFNIQEIGDTCGFVQCFPDNLKDLLTKFAYNAKPGRPANAMESWLVVNNDFENQEETSKNVKKWKRGKFKVF